MEREERVLILGLGNELLRDDGVGLRAARQVGRDAGGRADLAEACVATVDLLPLIQGYGRVVVIDAYTSTTEAPGTPVHATLSHRSSGCGCRSFHALPFDEMIALGKRLGLPMPRQVSIHGLCVGDATSFGTTFTPALERAWRPWAGEILRHEFG